MKAYLLKESHYTEVIMFLIITGRAIRHQKDYAIVLLLDRRYQKPSVAAKLPNWIRTLLKNCKFGQAVGAISKARESICLTLRCLIHSGGLIIEMVVESFSICYK